MADMPAINITSDYAYGFEKIRFETDDDTGHLLADFDPKARTFSIEAFGVTTPHIGLGRELLRLAEAKARELNAKQIKAAITSAECLASMTRVFGADSITVSRQGAYGRPGSTQARLTYYIEEPYL